MPTTVVDPIEPMLEQARDVVRRVHERAHASGRADVAAELAAASAGAEDDVVTVVVHGETGRGKSALVNALLDRPGLLPVGARAATARHVVVRRPAEGEPEGAVAHHAGGRVEPVGLDELADWVTVDGGNARDPQLTHVEIALEHPLLRAGIALVDTPGVGGLGRAQGEAARAALRMGEALLLVVDAGAPLSAVELRVLDEAARLAGPAAVVVNRKDVHAGWEEILREDQALLARRGDPAPPVIAVSARMKTRADRLRAGAGTADPAVIALREDSGLPALRAQLLRLCRERSAHLRTATLCRASLRAVDDLLAPERAVLRAEDERVARRTANVRQARASITELEAFAHWQRALLGDDLGDVHRRVDAELRRRCLRVQRELVAVLKGADEDALAQELEAALYRLQEEIVAFAGVELERVGQNVAAAARRHGVELESLTADLQARTVVRVAPGGRVELDARQLLSQLVLRGGVVAPAAIVASPALPVVAAVSALGMAMVVLERFGQGRRQQRGERIRETVGTLQIELAPLLARALTSARRGLEANLDHALRRRRSELTRTAEQLGATDRSQREAARRQAAQRVTDLEELSAGIERLGQSAVAALHPPRT